MTRKYSSYTERTEETEKLQGVQLKRSRRAVGALSRFGFVTPRNSCITRYVTSEVYHGGFNGGLIRDAHILHALRTPRKTSKGAGSTVLQASAPDVLSRSLTNAE